MVKEDGSFEVMEVKVWGPNFLLFQLQVGQKEKDRWYCVGGYLPPLDKAGEAQHLLMAEIRAVLDWARLVILDDLDADLESPQGRQKDVLATETDEHGLVCATKQVRCQKKQRHMHVQWTFW